MCLFFITYSYRSEDTVSLRVLPTKEAEFLLSASCCPWRRRVYPKVGHYVNVNHAWMAPRLCLCVCACVYVCHVVWPSHGFTFHPNFIGASGLLSALIELTSEEQSLFEESAGILRRHHLAVGAFNGVYIRISQRFRKMGVLFQKSLELGNSWAGVAVGHWPTETWLITKNRDNSEEDIYHSLHHWFPSFFSSWQLNFKSTWQGPTQTSSKQCHTLFLGIKEPWNSDIGPVSDKTSGKSNPVILMGYTFAVTG